MKIIDLILDNKKYIYYGVLVLLILTVIFFGGWVYQMKRGDRMTNNFKAEIIDSVRVFMLANNDTAYQEQPLLLTKKEFKETFNDEWDKIKNEFGIKHIHHYNRIKTETEKRIKTFVRDTLIFDTVMAKKWRFKDRHIEINGFEVGNSREIEWTHKLGLEILGNKKPRVGLWNKLFFKPRTRQKVYTVIPSDPNTIITEIKPIEITNN